MWPETGRRAAFHLFPVYVFPDLLTGISPELKKRMHGKSCFNFTKVDEALFAELARLTAAGSGSPRPACSADPPACYKSASGGRPMRQCCSESRRKRVPLPSRGCGQSRNLTMAS
jgi:hypothetical protein